MIFFAQELTTVTPHLHHSCTVCFLDACFLGEPCIHTTASKANVDSKANKHQGSVMYAFHYFLEQLTRIKKSMLLSLHYVYNDRVFSFTNGFHTYFLSVIDSILVDR